ncbi:MAG: polysaccharide pyruvyl transferase CsaB [Synechococcus sp.]
MGRASSGRRRPLIVGYYGEHNLGDDALLATLLEQLPEAARAGAVVTAADATAVAVLAPVATVPRRSLARVRQALAQADALVFGGGSLLQDSTSVRSLLYYALLIVQARLQGIPVLFWGQGLGPLNHRRSRWLVARLLPLVSAAAWRDAASAALARQLGRPPGDAMGADPVWTGASPAWHGRGGPIVLAWRPTPLLDPSGWQTLLMAVEQLAADTGREVLWLPFHADQDRALPMQLGSPWRQVPCPTVAAALDQLAGAGLVLAMRLHALILAIRCGAPAAALAYDPKVTAAATAAGCPCTDLKRPHAVEALLQSWRLLLDQPGPVDTVTALQNQAAVHSQLLEQWFSPAAAP